MSHKSLTKTSTVSMFQVSRSPHASSLTKTSTVLMPRVSEKPHVLQKSLANISQNPQLFRCLKSQKYFFHKKVSLMFHKNLNCLDVSQKPQLFRCLKSHEDLMPHEEISQTSHKNLNCLDVSHKSLSNVSQLNSENPETYEKSHCLKMRCLTELSTLKYKNILKNVSKRSKSVEFRHLNTIQKF